MREALAEAGVDPTYFGRFTSARGRQVLGGGELDYRAATPVLLACLDQVRDPRVLEAVVRSLSTSAARGSAFVPLLDLFRRTPNGQASLKWAIGNALSVVAQRTDLPAVYEVAIDRSHVGRSMLVGMLWRLAEPDPVPELRILVADPDCAFAAMSSLRRKVSPDEARSVIGPLTDNAVETVRNAARENLKRVNKASRQA